MPLCRYAKERQVLMFIFNNLRDGMGIHAYVARVRARVHEYAYANMGVCLLTVLIAITYMQKKRIRGVFLPYAHWS